MKSNLDQKIESFQSTFERHANSFRMKNSKYQSLKEIKMEELQQMEMDQKYLMMDESRLEQAESLDALL